MTVLIIGLLIFLGVHTLRLVPAGEAWRQSRIDAGKWLPIKGAYSLLSAVGLGLIIWGFSLARQAPVVLWQPPTGMRHLAALLTLISFVMLAAAYVPANHIKNTLQHPMTLAIKVWALAHLLANGDLASVVMFGAFVVWSVLVFRAARRRPAGAPLAPARWGMTALTAVVGVAAWGLFAMWLHAAWIGVAPLGR